MKKVVFLIRSINIGGAEKQLLTLLQELDKTRINPVVVTFYPGGDLLSEFNQANVRVVSAQKKRRWDILSFVYELIKIIKIEKPDVIVSYLVAANLLGLLCKPVFHPSTLIISIRHSYFRPEDYDRMSRILYFLQDKFAWVSDKIIVNSVTGARMAAKRGMPEDKMVIIPNGIDTDHYRLNLEARTHIRNIYGIPEQMKIAGMIGRIDPVKDHASFINAAVFVIKEIPDIRFLIVGSGNAEFEKELKTLIHSKGLEDFFLFIEAQKDLLGIYNSLDVCVSASIGEGFSNVIAEAMACEVPCVVTDVGDSAMIVGESGIIVPVGNPNELAKGMLKILSLSKPDKKQTGSSARGRIISEFTVRKMVTRTINEIEKLG